MNTRLMVAIATILVLTTLSITCSFGSDGSSCGNPGVRIHDIKGTGHESPLDGAHASKVPGIVTATNTKGFFMQDNNNDCRNETSEGIYVYVANKTNMKVGDYVEVSGTVSEYFGKDGLSQTEITNPTIINKSAGSVPPATLIGIGGRIPPDTVIDDDGF
jgi:uncharacterized protein